MVKFIKYLLAIIVAIVLLFAGYLWYLGLFSSITVDERAMGPYALVYQEYVGSYNDVGPVFDEVYNKLVSDGIDATLSMGVYYGNPDVVDELELKSEVGSLIDEVQATLINREKYSVKDIDQEQYMVVSIPFKNSLSYIIGVMKAYQAIEAYRLLHGYSQSEYSIELYLPDKTYYMMPIVQ
ncbi:hypothetical protein KJ673_01835 [Patescibacteria group bacterium]|nr:hypothetical protein [Patescibacteria group bacterium]MBU4453011.1 hypothetical protein [Patescibacteria group bacterium]